MAESHEQGPLMSAIFYHRPLDEIKAIVEADPTLVRRWWAPAGSLVRRLPLHEAIWMRSPPDVVRYLLEQWPESIREWTLHNWEGEKNLPLHLACDRSSSTDDDDDKAIRLRNRDGRLPVHLACSRFSDDDDMATILPLLDAWPDSLRERTKEGYLPVHIVHSVKLVKHLIELWPLPLHAAVASFPLRSYLLHYSNPETLVFGFPPDRFLMTLQKSMEIVGYLADQRPQSLTERDHLGNTPLHSALARDLASIDVVKQLVELGPESTGIANRNGSLPLHVAVSNCQPQVLINPDSSDSGYKPRPTPPLDIVKFLVEQRPDSVLVKDSNGNIPLVVAASSDADPNVVLYLIKQWPEAFCGGCKMAEPSPSSRPRKRMKTTSGGP